MSALPQRPSVQLSRDELQQLRWLLGGLLVLVSVATVPYLDIGAWMLMGLTTVAVGAVMVFPWLPGRIPRWAHRLSFPVIVAVFTGDLWLSGELLPALVRLDILLLLYRGITYRQKRDELQMIVLGLFLVVVAGVLTVSLTFAVHILAFTAGALALLLVITLADASSEVAGAAQSPGSTPNWALSVEWGQLLRRAWQVTDWRVVTMGSALFAGLVVLSAILFVAIPRFQLENSLFLERFITKKARSGFSDTIKFGDVTEIARDNGVALSVDVSDRNQIPDAPYWRMVVLDEYQEGAFRLSPGLRRSAFSQELFGRTVRGTQRGRIEDAATWVFYLESGVARYLPLLGAFDRLQFREPQSFRTMQGVPMVALRDDPVTMIAYRVEGMQSEPVIVDTVFGARFAASGNKPVAAAALMLSLQLQASDHTVLARIRNEIGGGDSPSAAEFAERAGVWLKQRHRYSLSPKIPPGMGDPLVRWMDSEEGGHCELFAGSLVVLARSAGFPARVVTGFRGGSWNGYSNNFTLRNSDAHAWCEVFDAQSQSWLRVDPTPGAVNDDPLAMAGAANQDWRNDRSWNARLESLRVFWYRRIVSFDQRSQLDTLQAMKQATEKSSQRLRVTLDAWGEKIRTWFAMPWSGRRLAGLLSGLALLAAVGLLTVRAYHFFKFGTSKGHRRGSGDRARAEAGRWLAKFGERQHDRDSSKEQDEVIRELQRIRYGKRETWSEVVPVLRNARRVWRAEKQPQQKNGFRQ